jgi:hypothetical protein
VSYVEVFVVEQNGDVVSFGATSNNHGFAPLVWDKLGEQYEVPREDPRFPLMMDKQALEALWNKCGTGELDPLDDLLLAATFDRIWVKRKLVPDLIKACRAFHERHIAGRYVDTVARTADMMGRLLEECPDAIGVAFNMCSANEPFWSWYDEEEDDHVQYNVLTREEHPGPGEYAGKKHQVLE